MQPTAPAHHSRQFSNLSLLLFFMPSNSVLRHETVCFDQIITKSPHRRIKSTGKVKIFQEEMKKKWMVWMSYGDLEGKLTTPYRRYLRQMKNFDPALPKSFNIDSSPDRTKTFRCRNSKDPHLEGGIGENPVRSRSPGHLLPGAHARPLPAKVFKELRFEAIRGSTEHPEVSHLKILKRKGSRRTDKRPETTCTAVLCLRSNSVLRVSLPEFAFKIRVENNA